MNILLMTTHLNTGGITSYLLTLCRGLIKQEHDVHLVSSGGNCADDFSELGVKNLSFDIRTKSEIHPKIYFPLPKLVQYAREHHIQIIHSHTRVTQVMGQVLHLITNIPYATTCHGYFRVRASRKFAPCWGEGVVAISSQVQEHLEKDFRIPRDRIFLIHNGVDIQFYAPLGDALIQERRKSFRLDKDKRVIGIIARLSDVKGHEYLIRAMPKIIESFSQIRLMIFGRGKLESGLVSLVERLQLQEYVEFHPVVNRTAEVLPIFDVFVMPSLQEGLGISIMEAQAAGIPVVASNVGGIPSLIQHGKTGVLVEPRDYKGIARAIIRLLADPVQARAMGIRSREFIKEIFSAEKMTSDTVAFYQYCMNFRIQQNSSRLLP